MSAAAPSPMLPAHRWLLARLKRSAVVMVALVIGITLLLGAIDRGRFGVKLVYTLAISLACWFFVEGVRLIVAFGVARSRVRRGLAPALEGFHLGWPALALLLVLAVALGPTIGLAVGDWLTGGTSASPWQLDRSSARITLIVTVLAVLVSAAVIGAQENLAGERLRAEAAQRQASESRLKLLESQLEPHMLFNTLANLRVLIGVDPARAQAMLDRLIAYLRATLAASRAERHPLATEFDRLADYLALMAVRMGPRLAVRFDLPEALRGVPVPPLVLQPLVENAIQHGLEPKVEGGSIEVAARREGERLVLTVRDSGVGLPAAGAARAGGFGLVQVRERLATLYEDDASLVLAPAPAGGTIATLTLPLPA